jgi:hypothetical protein
MSDPDEPKPRGFPAEGVSLGGLGADGYDRSLTPGDEDAGLEPEGEGPGRPPAARPGDEDDLALPRGGLVAFRKSGGLRFTSRGITVYRTGWVVPLEGTEGRPRHMTDEALQALEALLLHSGMSRRRHEKAAGSRDGYYYEITARYGGRTRYAEVADGAIPEELRRLIDVLQRLMPKG